ncbi:aldo/keto reductase family domain-containing protein [Phthorimaea operculella]|nr:aldo/keto reductase family domain-containing protein [Phthorimaea operculella]
MLRLFVFIFLVAIVSSVQVPTTTLNDGNQIPALALGTYGSAEDIAKMRQTINSAVEAGYRHIDTASLYGNEDQIGLGIKDVISRGLVKREDLFVTTKLWNDRHARDQVVPALRESLARLGLDYVDLYLIHFPDAQNADGSPANIDYLDTWKGMEEAKKLGLAKSIGISNFDVGQVDRLVANSEIKPAVNEIEIHPTLTQEALVDHCHKLGIVVMAYSPFGFVVNRGNPNAPPPRADDPTLTAIAKKYGKNTSQVVLRYLLDRGTIPIPKSTNPDRLRQNIDVFDFQLTPEEVATISKFNQNKSVFGS